MAEGSRMLGEKDLPLPGCSLLHLPAFKPPWLSIYTKGAGREGAANRPMRENQAAINSPIRN